MPEELKNEFIFREPSTLLIVDDDDITRGILGNIFAEDYRILEAEDGEEGLEKLFACEDDICALFLDMMMPKMDGVQVLERLKDKNVLEHVPVFLITAETDDAVIKSAYQLGVMDVINKPVNPYIIRRRVHSVVELFRARQRLNNTVQRQEDELKIQANKIIQLNYGMIEALACAIEFRSGESGEHVRRLRSITRCMLRHTKLGEGLSTEEIDQIGLAAIMHDVGKIAIPDAILNKPGKLTKEEFEIMKTHSAQGEILIKSIPQMHEHGVYHYACDIARHHHERWDGRGYPDGLKGDEISIYAQIVSLADVYDALVSPRVYKRSFTHEEAWNMIFNGECGAFNPDLLEHFALIEDRLKKMYSHL